MVCTAARSTARRTVSWPSDDPHTTAEPARVVAKLVIGDGVVTTQRRPPFSDHNASVVDAATTTEASTSKIASFVAGGDSRRSTTCRDRRHLPDLHACTRRYPSTSALTQQSSTGE
jgi:hypothetical protein